jgi:hypothetical protein
MPMIEGIWFPRFPSRDRERTDFHMNDFYSYVGLHLVDDDVKDLVMKIFPTTFHGNDKKWYDDIPDSSML